MNLKLFNLFVLMQNKLKIIKLILKTEIYKNNILKLTAKRLIKLILIMKAKHIKNIFLN